MGVGAYRINAPNGISTAWHLPVFANAARREILVDKLCMGLYGKLPERGESVQDLLARTGMVLTQANVGSKKRAMLAEARALLSQASERLPHAAGNADTLNAGGGASTSTNSSRPGSKYMKRPRSVR